MSGLFVRYRGNALVQAFASRAAAQLSEKLGRAVTLRDARVKLLPTPGIAIGQLVVAGAAPREAALFKAGPVAIEPRLWPHTTSGVTPKLRRSL